LWQARWWLQELAGFGVVTDNQQANPPGPATIRGGNTPQPFYGLGRFPRARCRPLPILPCGASGKADRGAQPVAWPSGAALSQPQPCPERARTPPPRPVRLSAGWPGDSQRCSIGLPREGFGPTRPPCPPGTVSRAPPMRRPQVSCQACCLGKGVKPHEPVSQPEVRKPSGGAAGRQHGGGAGGGPIGGFER